MTGTFPATQPRHKSIMSTGRTPRKLRAAHKRRIEQISKSLISISGDWEDLTNGPIEAVDAVLAALEELETALDEAVDYLEEAAP